MAHHSSEPDERMRKAIEGLNLGATGQFPQGKLTTTDEGEIQMAVDVQSGKVVIHFGKAVAWVGFDYEQAMALADSIRDRAFETRGITR